MPNRPRPCALVTILVVIAGAGCVGYRPYRGPDLDVVSARVASRVEQLRGEELTQLVEIREVSAAELEAFIGERLRHSHGSMGQNGKARGGARSSRRGSPGAARQQIQRETRAFRLIGLYEGDVDGVAATEALMRRYLVGYFDPIRNHLGLVQSSLAFGRIEAGLARELVLAHELTHALQNQRCNGGPTGTGEGLYGLLNRGWERGSDGHLATLALLEGEAQAVMYAFVLSGSNKDLGDVDGRLGDAIQAGLDPMIDRHPTLGTARGRSVREARLLLFPYYAGATFIQEVVRARGWSGVDRLYTESEALSTEQILHPEKVLETRDSPTPVELQLPAAVRDAGWQTYYEDTLGEIGLRALLERGLAPAEALRASIGWDGDRLVVAEREGELAYAWAVVCDSSRDAGQLYQAMIAHLATIHGPTRVVDDRNHGDGESRRLESETGPIWCRWSGSRVLLHVGFDRAQHGSLERTLEAGAGHAGPVSDAASTRAAEERALAELDATPDTATELPRIRGDVLDDPLYGFRLRRPDGGRWHFVPSRGFGVRRARLQRVDDLDAESLLPLRYFNVDVIPMNLPLDLEQLAHQIERQLAFSLAGFRRLGRARIEFAGHPAVELRYRGTQGGATLRFRQVTFIRDGRQFNVTAASPVMDYESDHLDFQKIFESLRF